MVKNKLKEIFETGGGDFNPRISLSNSSIILLIFLIPYFLFLVFIYSMFTTSKNIDLLLSGIGIILAITALLIRIFGTKKIKKFIKTW